MPLISVTLFCLILSHSMVIIAIFIKEFIVLNIGIKALLRGGY